MFATKPNTSDYQTFLKQVAGIPASALEYSTPDPTVAPSLSETPGGTIPPTVYFVVYTYTNANGTTLASPGASLAVDDSNLLVVASPAAATGATSWAAYVGLTAGQETLQASGLTIGVDWTLPDTGLVVGVVPPILNTTEALSIQTSFALAVDIVNLTLAQASRNIYVLAVYNLATDRLINFAQDLPNQSYFTNLRKTWNLTIPVVGVASSGSDQGTSSAWLNPEQLRMLTLADLQTLKTPFGRQYLGIAQSYGPIWGLT